MSEQNKIQCPNCGKKNSLFNSVTFLSQDKIDFINKYHDAKCFAYCNSSDCGSGLFENYSDQIKTQKEFLISKLKNKNFNILPLISLPNPFGWDYSIIDLVHAQSTTGTGAVTEIFAEVADFMGNQSTGHNNKIEIAISNCKNQLRKQSVLKGGNAVIGCNVNIATGGTGNGLIIVCMTGTSILINNTEIFSEIVNKAMSDILQLHNEIINLPKVPVNDK